MDFNEDAVCFLSGFYCHAVLRARLLDSVRPSPEYIFSPKSLFGFCSPQLSHEPVSPSGLQPKDYICFVFQKKLLSLCVYIGCLLTPMASIKKINLIRNTIYHSIMASITITEAMPEILDNKPP